MIATLLLMSAVSTVDYYTHDGWVIEKRESTCALIGSYGNEQALAVDYNPRLNTAIVIVSDPAFKSVAKGKPYELKLVFIKAGEYEDTWGVVNATGLDPVTVDNVTHRSIFFNAKGLPFLEDLSAAQTMALLNGEVVVSSLSLKGSAKVIPELRKCAWEAQSKNPSDPLAN